ncbi:antibiotic biosynthesis monooxygenase family protein [Curtobacterium sp. MCSS17_007]|uniref:putative quinol monooxygenase n=1 Tax=Curtobacterium sp. MCSS17_007 TaxID=2175646 RepID=UPI000DA7E139|nr:antibiotic biosynthesis monooxygenase family protein [Curtobacterium sp. MCSS17_007]WIE75163.1 antibiotic biosynthesis monooxygenase family protein [Curtobacterium sp. MCSS17_007]
MTQTVFLEVQLRDDVAQDAIESAIRDTLAQTAAFPGNESLEVLVDDTDPLHLVVLERWTTAADHDAYVAWRATDEGAPTALAAVVAAPPITRTFGRTLDLG